MNNLKIVNISGNSLEDFLQTSKSLKSFMGISLGHRFFSTERMEEYIVWGSKHFHEFVIFLMDYPDRFNFEVFKKLDPEIAKIRAIEQGKEKLTSFQKIIKKTNCNNVKVFRMYDLWQKPEYQNILKILTDYCLNDQNFKKEVDEMMYSFIGPKLELLHISDPSTTLEDYTKVLANYILEELAALIYLTENGYTVEIDPHKEFIIKKNLYEGKYQELFNKLRITTERVHLDLQIPNVSYTEIGKSHLQKTT